MKHIKTTGIILSRTNYGEADRILTILTPDHGKLRLMARGVRKAKSKLAGGIELFSTSHLTFIEGKGASGLGTLISSRLIKHYGDIVNDINRVQLGYELIKLLDRATEDHPEPEYYELLDHAFAALDDPKINAELIRVWFSAQLLRQAGHTPSLNSLPESQKYSFDLENMVFTPQKAGNYTANHIKALRLLFSRNSPVQISKVQGIEDLLPNLTALARIMLQSHLHL